MNSVYARSEVLTAVVMKIQVFWNVTPCRGVNSYRRFGGAQCLYFRRQTVQIDTPMSLLGLLNPEEGQITLHPPPHPPESGKCAPADTA
jgi:hypothetical protein